MAQGTQPTGDQQEPKQPVERHVWMGAANIPLTPSAARIADRRGVIGVRERMVVDVVEVYCKKCRQPHSRVASQPCANDMAHLRGGPLGRRQRTKPGTDDVDDAAAV